jgi:putative hydrolase of the HAD superfamily
MKSGVVFDLDDTLIDRRDVLEAYAQRLWKDFDLQAEIALPRFVASFLAWDDDGHTPPDELFDAVVRAFPKSHLDATRISGHYSDFAWSRPTLADGVASALEQMRSRGPVGIITNGEGEGQRRKLRSTGLIDLVDHYLISGEFGAEKPDASIFHAMCSALDIDPALSWFIGDHPVFDIWGAHRIGFRTIWLAKRVPWPHDRDPCYTHSARRIEEVFEIVGRTD